MTQIINNKFLVLGLGISGCSAVAFLLSQGAAVETYDRNLETIQDKPEIQLLRNQGMKFFEPSKTDVRQFNAIVVSPGIPFTDQTYQAAIRSGIPIIGEAELALRHLLNRCIGITGTNGKTTVTLLIEHVLNVCGIEAKAVGNVGIPLTSMVGNIKPLTVLVVELSSYQLETMQSKVLDVAILLNITPDHLDRYGNLLDYAKAKMRIFDSVKPKGKSFISEHCSLEWKELQNKDRYFVYDKDVSLLENIKNQSLHDKANLCAAYYACREFGVTAEQFIHAQKSFTKPAHRLEFVTKLNGVNFIDDSKGTNIDAVIKAVESINGPIVLIAGGVDKGFSYNSWIKPFYGKVKLICSIGEASEKISSELSSCFKVEQLGSLEEAVNFAKENSSKGDTVLLSPGCASYDMFTDYAHRGREFKRIVQCAVI